jgi:arylformamidase
MATYAGEEPGPVLTFHSLIKDGQSANVGALSVGLHSGTHVDAPHHFLDNDVTVELMPVEALIGEAYVVDMDVRGHITASDLDGAGIPAAAKRLLLKTPNGRFWDDTDFHPEFIGLAEDAAPWLMARGFVLVGIDYMSIERFRSPTHAVHTALLKEGVVILEGLDLRGISPGRYFMVCAPLKLEGADGAPARVFLIEDLEGV